MAPSEPSHYVTLISNDGFEFIVRRDAACVAGTIRKMLDPQSKCSFPSKPFGAKCYIEVPSSLSLSLERIQILGVSIAVSSFLVWSSFLEKEKIKILGPPYNLLSLQTRPSPHPSPSSPSTPPFPHPSHSHSHPHRPIRRSHDRSMPPLNPQVSILFFPHPFSPFPQPSLSHPLFPLPPSPSPSPANAGAPPQRRYPRKSDRVPLLQPQAPGRQGRARHGDTRGYVPGVVVGGGLFGCLILWREWDGGVH